MEKFLFKLNEPNPRSVYRNNEGVLIIKGKNSELDNSESFKRIYNRFIFDNYGLRAIFNKFYGLSYSTSPQLSTQLFKFLFMPAPKITKYGNILDIGCSTGEFLNNLPRGWQKSGIEINKKASQLARGKGLNVKNCSLENYKTSKKFDLVRACHVIEHFNNYDGFFKKARALLKKDGLLVIYTPNSKSLSYILTGNDWGYFYEKTHFLIFNVDNLRNIAKKYNFELVECHTYYMGNLIDSLLRKIKIQNSETRRVLYYFFSIVFFPFSLLDKIFNRGDSLVAVFKK